MFKRAKVKIVQNVGTIFLELPIIILNPESELKMYWQNK